MIDKYRERFEKQGIELVNPTYAAMVETLDHTVGQLLDELERLGLRDNTIIIFSSDNGAVAELHAHPFIVSDNSPLFHGKVTMYEGGIRVPLLVDWPGVTEPGSVTDVPVDIIDLFPTILEMVGAEIPAGQVHDGVSWVPLLRGEENFERGALFWHYPHIVNPRPRFPGRNTHFVGVARQGDWKLIL
ncbi:sulfatase-like hydrolase/transferase, partial [Arthrospira platensis SPKY1]|nr:sulfatase-like hydrolase/transferase [Arthrospira platensis SPKY1]